MRKEFLIEIGTPDDYNYISGRIKILESLLLKRETFERLSGAELSKLKEILFETPYKPFIKGDKSEDLLDAVFERFRAELSEMEKYASEGFINAFFRNKEVFLKLKKWALMGETEEESELYSSLEKFVHNGGEDFPPIFFAAFRKMSEVKENPLEVGITLDVFRLKYLLDSAEETRSQLIKDYYDTYAEVSLKNMLFRMSGFVRSSLIDINDMRDALLMISENFPQFGFTFSLKGIKETEQFESFVSENLKNTDSVFVQKALTKILDRGKFFNTGIEVVFAYLKKLEFEVSTLSMVLSGKQAGMESGEILKKVVLTS